MKKILACALFLLWGSSVLFAADPLIGKWDVEVIGLDKIIVFNFINDKELEMSIDGETQKNSYSYDKKTGNIEIESLSEKFGILRIVFSGNKQFDLYAGEKGLEYLNDLFVSKMAESMSKLPDTSVDRDMMNTIVKSMQDSFRRISLFRGRKN
jgi:hypothetical protein